MSSAIRSDKAYDKKYKVFQNNTIVFICQAQDILKFKASVATPFVLLSLSGYFFSEVVVFHFNIGYEQPVLDL